MKKIIVLFLLVFISEAFAADPIVYSRCKRTTAPVELSATITVSGEPATVSRIFYGTDIYDVLPDVTNFFDNFSAPCDLVYRDAKGVETVLYDCSTTSSMGSSCAALDPQVSPDGSKIAFSVFKGTLKNHIEMYFDARVLHPEADPGQILGHKTFPNTLLIGQGAQLMYYDLVENEVIPVLPYISGVWDSGPTFITNNRLAFTSTRDGNTATVVFRTTASKKGTRIWAVDLDGKNLDLSSHHSTSQEQHPFMLKDGRVAYSSWQIFGGIPFRHGAPGAPDTIDNFFHIYAQDPDGAGNFPIYGQHSGDHLPSYFGENHVAAHFLTQTSDGRIWFADYYRGNNSGLGAVIGVMPEPKGQEGFAPSEVAHHGDWFVPRDAINFAAWATNADQMSDPLLSPAVTHPNYADPIPFAGKLGHPAALSGNGLMLAWGKGACSSVVKQHIFEALGRPVPPVVNGNGAGAGVNLLTSLGMDIPGCDTGLYRATTIPSVHPNDLEMIVDSPDWHEIMARAVVPYSAIHGVAAPEVIKRSDLRTTHASLETGTPFGLLGAASIIDRETHPHGGIRVLGTHVEKQFNLQGTDTIDYTDEELCGVRILGVLPNRSPNVSNEIANYAGERIAILGEVPVLNYDNEGNRIIDPSGNPDTSFLVKMPANMPHILQAIDCNGSTLNTDQTWQALRPGEVKTCGGCHVHSREPRITFEQSYAATGNYTIPELGKGVVSLMEGRTGNTVHTRTVGGYGMRLNFTQDIKPIFDARCISCHSGGEPAGGLNLNAAGQTNTAVGAVWYCLVRDSTQTCIPSELKFPTGADGFSIRRPQLTKYMKAFSSRASLLYWKAAGQRTDNRTDEDVANDINFGAAHMTDITAQELGILARWIDIGAPGGSQELLDTQKPTLHVAATVADNDGPKLTHLHIGTVDLGSGINTASLSVKVNNGSNLAGTAQVHGIVTITLRSPITNPADIITATVADISGNTTTIERTAAYFFSDL